MSGELLGDHGRIVEGLVKRLAALAAGDETAARVVLLRGPSGSGKSRIIQEVYEHLRRNAAPSEYWPVLPSRREHGDPLVARKWLSPDLSDFVWRPGALPTYGWWSFNCERLSQGVRNNVVVAAREQLDTHLLPLTLAGWENASRTSKAKAAVRSVLADIRQLAVDGVRGDAAAQLIETAGYTIPFAGPLVNWGVKGFRKVEERFRHREALRAEVDIGNSLTDFAQSAGHELAGVISALAGPDLPAVVAIEDIHLMGPDLTALVEALAAAEQPVVVIATSWPEAHANYRNRDYLDWFERGTHLGQVEVLDVPALSGTELGTLLREYAPNTSEHEAHRIVEAVPNPLFLKTWLSSPALRIHIRAHDGAVVLGENGLTLPRDIEHVLAQRWDALDEHVQSALAFAAAAHPGQDPAGQFLPEVIIAAAETFQREIPGVVATRPEQVGAGLRQAVDPAAWCRVAGETEFFAEESLTAHARDRSQELFGAAGRDLLRRAAREKVEEWILTRAQGLLLPEGPESLVAAAWLLETRGNPDELEPAALRARAIAHVTVGFAHDLARAHGAAIDQLAAAVHLLQHLGAGEDPDALSTRRRLASLLLESGKLDRAVGQWTAIVDDSSRVLGADHPDTLTARNNLAHALSQAGRASEARSLLRSVLEQQNAVLGTEHTDTLVTRGNLALAEARSGDLTEAARQLRSLLADETQLLGAGDPDALMTRNNLALITAQSGDLVAAERQFRTLLTDHGELFGAEHPGTLLARGNLGYTLAQVGKLAEAGEHLRSLLDDQTALVGAGHPGTLRTRYNLAFLLAQTGDVATAMQRLAELVDDQTAALGPGHPDTLTTRDSLAQLLGQAGSPAGAAEQLRALLRDREQILGPDHPDTLHSRGNLASQFASAGHLAEAAEQFRALLKHQLRVLGPEDPRAMATRNNLALVVGTQGDHRDAVEQFRWLLEDQLAVLGADHPDTLTTRNNLAQHLRQTGDLTQAADQLRELVRDRERILGADHPDTLTTRNNLISVVGALGGTAEAIEQFRALIERQRSVLGADHPGTLTTRNNLAHQLGQAGKLGEASAHFRQLLEDQLRVLGAGHPDTLRTRNNLAQIIGQQGQP